MRFDGADYDHDRDSGRLTGQCLRIFTLMKDGKWRTLSQIADATNDPEPSVSAQLRCLRKERFGSHIVNREFVANGLYKYQLIVNTSSDKGIQKKKAKRNGSSAQNLGSFI